MVERSLMDWNAGLYDREARPRICVVKRRRDDIISKMPKRGCEMFTALHAI